MKKIRNIKQAIKLDEVQLEKLVKESMKRVLKESHDLPYLSDKDIHHQYEDFKIDEFTIKPKERYDGTFSWDICFEISFPNVDHPDFDESKIENPMVYDEMGKQIAFDHWYPDDIYEKLVTIIRNEIKKHWPEMKALKEKIRKDPMNEETNMNDNIIVYVDPNSNNDYYGVNDFNTLKLAAKTDRSIHFYRNLDDFIQAFNDGYVSDEGYLINPM